VAEQRNPEALMVPLGGNNIKNPPRLLRRMQNILFGHQIDIFISLQQSRVKSDVNPHYPELVWRKYPIKRGARQTF
jgi:hypothetical protein